MVHCGCKTLSLKDFKSAVIAKHGKNNHAKLYLANVTVMTLVAKESKADYEASTKKPSPGDGGGVK